MSQLAIKCSDGRMAFEPGETISLEANWDLNSEPFVVEVRLVWNTCGKGDTDIGVEKTIRLESPGQSGSRRVELELPSAPYSFSGKLISLLWALELVAKPTNDSSRTEITIAPGACEIMLHDSAIERSWRHPMGGS